MTRTHQIEGRGIPAKSLQAISDVIDTERSANSYEGRPTYFSSLQAANSCVNVVKPTRMRSWK
jgi:hypothetical protein